MIKLAVTGLISSGKTTATNIISKLGIPKFCADQTVKNVYLHNLAKNIAKVSKKYNVTCERQFEINENRMIVGFTSKGCF